jgi:hypothetical protein
VLSLLVGIHLAARGWRIGLFLGPLFFLFWALLGHLLGRLTDDRETVRDGARRFGIVGAPLAGTGAGMLTSYASDFDREQILKAVVMVAAVSVAVPLLGAVFVGARKVVEWVAGRPRD